VLSSQTSSACICESLYTADHKQSINVLQSSYNSDNHYKSLCCVLTVLDTSDLLNNCSHSDCTGGLMKSVIS